MADIHVEKKKRVRGSISKQQGYNPCLHKSSPRGLFHGQLGFNMVPSFGSSRWAAKRRGVVEESEATVVDSVLLLFRHSNSFNYITVKGNNYADYNTKQHQSFGLLNLHPYLHTGPANADSNTGATD
ncbi:unnamed protein product [Gadus morhua 'NCC']